MKQTQGSPSYLTVLIGGGAAGAFVSILLGAIALSIVVYVTHHKSSQITNGVLSKMPISVSAPLIHQQNTTPALVAGTPPQQGSHKESSYIQMRPASFAPLVHRVIPAVVNISTDDPEPDPNAHQQPLKDSQPHTDAHQAMTVVCSPNGSKTNKPCVGKTTDVPKKTDAKKPDSSSSDDDDSSAMGSGFIIDPSGVIVTNAHVVNSTGIIHVSLSDGRVLTAKLLGTDPLTDVAVLKVNTDSALPYVNWGRSRSMQIGDWVVAAGNPFGFGSSITAGIVSAVGRDLGLGDLDDFMQFDAPINPGNSGGPTFNMKGEVVAMNAAIATPNEGSVGIGFGIPSDLVAPIVKQIEDSGVAIHGWLGVTLNDDNLPVQIIKVDPNSAAAQAGLKPHDKILQIDGVPVQSARAILRSVGLSAPGTVFAFTVIQDGVEHSMPIKLSARPDTATKDGDAPQDADNSQDSSGDSET